MRGYSLLEEEAEARTGADGMKENDFASRRSSKSWKESETDQLRATVSGFGLRRFERVGFAWHERPSVGLAESGRLFRDIDAGWRSLDVFDAVSRFAEF